ncbi:hydrogenase [Cryobacterium sp. TMT2-18-3]|uniref:proton-conducting transporter transmembrane domain-containing protein n=1 Tax=unclassified Cryobacterium TaxID=2649013 RepID=UPI00106B872E|nr:MULTISPECIES: proton-conducting transporter membrane subunit [unclassified Cryobacterium]TFC25941.1 hydrogenase [Cryobacterium sp. TMT2-18-2]TFC32495.1 hydrogenase [Cryobacterium sp. TMT2-42-4]TFC65375.1 hydrogenase [Cryobacterium sp. TMT2-18-3]
MSFALWTPLAIPALLAVLSLGVPSPALRRLSPIASSVAVLISGLLLVSVVLADEVPTLGGGLLRADALSAYMLTVVGAVGLVSTWGGLGHATAEPARFAGSYDALISIFLAAMSLAVLADNIGLMWAAVEATTIATAFLVGHHRTPRSLEAAWKYVILGSVGVAIALLGIVLIYAASRGTGEATLSWLVLSQAGLPLDPALIRAGGALAVLGFATKAGLAPMHSWLPDAHSQAPAPVSGLMSGVLLAVALYAILRIQTITDAVIGPDFLRIMLSVGGLLSLFVAAALLIRQRDFKRMLAYSSIEHMGMMAIGAAIGAAALPAVLLYVLGHGLTKATLFVISGRILEVEGTPKIDDVRALLVRRPGLAVPWLIAMAALIGFPPFSIFFSEVGIIVAGFSTGLGVVVGIALVLLLVIFASLTRLTVAMTIGAPAATAVPAVPAVPAAAVPAAGAAASVTGAVPVSIPSASVTLADAAPHPDDPLVPDRSGHGPMLPLILALGTTAVVAFIADPVGTLLTRAAEVLGGIQ